MPRRIVFLGDSITDGHSYPLLIRQALAEAGKPVPVCVNAGIGGDTAAGMLRRLDRDVFPRRPDLVTLSVGINDVLHRVPDADYRRDVNAIADRMKSAGVRLLILTTSVLGPGNAAADEHLAAYNQILRQVADAHGFPVAEVNRLMREARARGVELVETDHVHPNYAGHRLMARAVLDALGSGDVAVPEVMKVQMMPGVISPWQIRPAGEKDKPLDAAAAAGVKPGASWKPYALPDAERQEQWWLEQERRRGFALALEKVAGKARRYVGYATVESPGARRAFLNPGAGLESIWLNGKRIYHADGWHGWHAGRERVAVELRAGPNTLVIETGPQFFLSLTDDDQW